MLNCLEALTTLGSFFLFSFFLSFFLSFVQYFFKHHLCSHRSGKMFILAELILSAKYSQLPKLSISKKTVFLTVLFIWNFLGVLAESILPCWRCLPPRPSIGLISSHHYVPVVTDEFTQIAKHISDQGNRYINGPHQGPIFHDPATLFLALWAKNRILIREGEGWYWCTQQGLYKGI